jgi:ribosomal protein S18 acetylase RimI-like enzyme
MQEALAIARRQKHLESATLLVHETNEAAHLLYRSIGFSEDGIMLDYYR